MCGDVCAPRAWRRYVVGAVDGCTALSVWCASSGDRLMTLPVCGGRGGQQLVVSAVAVSADGRRFAAAVASADAAAPAAAPAAKACEGGPGGRSAVVQAGSAATGGGRMAAAGSWLSSLVATGGSSSGVTSGSGGLSAADAAAAEKEEAGDAPCAVVWELLWPAPTTAASPAEEEAEATRAAASSSDTVDGNPPPPSLALTARLLLSLPGRIAHPSGGGATACALSPDGALLVTGGRDSAVRAWSLPSGALVAKVVAFPPPPADVASAAAAAPAPAEQPLDGIQRASSAPPPQRSLGRSPAGALFPDKYLAVLAQFALPRAASTAAPASPVAPEAQQEAPQPPPLLLRRCAAAAPASDVVSVAVSAVSADGSVLIAGATGAPQKLLPWDSTDPRLDPRAAKRLLSAPSSASSMTLLPAGGSSGGGFGGTMLGAPSAAARAPFPFHLADGGWAGASDAGRSGFGVGFGFGGAAWPSAGGFGGGAAGHSSFRARTWSPPEAAPHATSFLAEPPLARSRPASWADVSLRSPNSSGTGGGAGTSGPSVPAAAAPPAAEAFGALPWDSGLFAGLSLWGPSAPPPHVPPLASAAGTGGEGAAAAAAPSGAPAAPSAAASHEVERDAAGCELSTLSSLRSSDEDSAGGGADPEAAPVAALSPPRLSGAARLAVAPSGGGAGAVDRSYRSDEELERSASGAPGRSSYRGGIHSQALFSFGRFLPPDNLSGELKPCAVLPLGSQATRQGAAAATSGLSSCAT